MPVWPRSSSRSLEKTLARKEAELMRRKAELEERLVILPSVIEARQREEAERIGRRARVAGRPISPGGPGVRRPVKQRTPGQRARAARLKA
ncbi:MAG: hypothetical protein N2322_06475, partial [Terrimicrobiaceae bacterium]|nr:hypothetical protein [Terrimicrobiaceae bacterium]